MQSVPLLWLVTASPTLAALFIAIVCAVPIWIQSEAVGVAVVVA